DLCLSIWYYNPEAGIELFLKLCDTEEALLGSPSVERFLHAVVATHFDKVRGILERMVKSDLSDVAEIGARQACVASLVLDEARPLAEICLSGGEVLSAAAAQVFSSNVSKAACRQFCKVALMRLFNSADVNVQRTAAHCFYSMDGSDLTDFADLASSL